MGDATENELKAMEDEILSEIDRLQSQLAAAEKLAEAVKKVLEYYLKGANDLNWGYCIGKSIPLLDETLAEFLKAKEE